MLTLVERELCTFYCNEAEIVDGNSKFKCKKCDSKLAEKDEKYFSGLNKS